MIRKYIRSNTKSNKGYKSTQHTLILCAHTLQTSSLRKKQTDVFSAAFFFLCQKTKSAGRFFLFGYYLYLLLPNALQLSHSLLVFIPLEYNQKALRGLAAVAPIFWGGEDKKNSKIHLSQTKLKYLWLYVYFIQLKKAYKNNPVCDFPHICPFKIKRPVEVRGTVYETYEKTNW